MPEPSIATLCTWLVDARRRTLDLVADLDDAQLVGPRLAIVNPLGWELGHIAWFQEHWVLRHALGRAPLVAHGDALYDSSAVAHDTRWDLPLLDRRATLAFLDAVLGAVLEALAGPVTPALRYFALLAIFHEDMHGEAFHYTRQTLGYPAPRLHHDSAPGAASVEPHGPHPGDAKVPGGRFTIGAEPGQPFVFDNEKWAHAVDVAPFAMARAPVTQGDYALFVDEGGYRRRDLWSEAGWRWREAAGAAHPLYWRRDHASERASEKASVWWRRDFDQHVPLEPHRPVVHVNWYEAEAYCRFAGRRLPTEIEWEVAASGQWERGADGALRLANQRRRFPWGDAPPAPEHGNLDGRAPGCTSVAACGAGDSAFGCRQLIGNVWQWTADDFLPYPGFVADPYKEYSEPWFGDHKVLRGGAFPTRARLVRNTWRNFYKPDRRDVWSGFRTCALTVR